MKIWVNDLNSRKKDTVSFFQGFLPATFFIQRETSIPFGGTAQFGSEEVTGRRFLLFTFRRSLLKETWKRYEQERLNEKIKEAGVSPLFAFFGISPEVN